MSPTQSIARLAVVLAAACGPSEGDARAEPTGAPETAGSENAAPEPSVSEEPLPEEEPAETDRRAGASGAQGSPPSYACRLERDYNQCIVDRLEGHANTEADFVLLIQSYRLLGQSDDARRHMETFIERYPESPQAMTYRDYLGR